MSLIHIRASQIIIYDIGLPNERSKEDEFKNLNNNTHLLIFSELCNVLKFLIKKYYIKIIGNYFYIEKIESF